MPATVVIIVTAALVFLVALVIIRPTDVEVAARGVRVRLRRRTQRRKRDRHIPPKA